MNEPLAEGEFLKCDAVGCDHFEMTPVTIDVVDKPCPKCGANLCTADDFVAFRTFAAASKASLDLLLKVDPNAPLTLIAHNVHDGKLKIAVDPIAGMNPFPNDGVEA